MTAVPPRPFTYDPPKEPWLDIVHEDADILVLAKPCGLLMVEGNRPGLEDCLIARARGHHRHAALVHRLDKDTSGVCVLALHHKAQRHLGRQFEKRRVAKTYIARVAGEMAQDTGTVDAPIATDPDARPKQRIDRGGGRPAVTRWQVTGREPGVTRVALMPETGRSHQLRVHMAFLGHAILGDNFYADDRVLAMADRLQLHAETLAFRHPSGGGPVRFTVPCPF